MTVIEGTLEDIPQITSLWEGIDSLERPPAARSGVSGVEASGGFSSHWKASRYRGCRCRGCVRRAPGWIYAVWVEPEVRRQGLGRLIVSEAEAWLLKRGAETVHLQIRYSNLAVLGFCEKLGYHFQDIVVLGKSLHTASDSCFSTQS